MEVGIYGGSFNPPHHAHVICAQAARIELGLDEVRLMPAGNPPHRQLESDPGSELRLAMVRLAAIGQPGLVVSTDEIERGGASWTVDTLEALALAEPDTKFTLIIGADQAQSFGRWREPERIGELAAIAVAGRGEEDLQAALSEVERVTGAGRSQSFAMPRIDITSTSVRELAARGETVAHLVPAGVAEVIEQEGLYR